jgi:hypothetical protein
MGTASCSYRRRRERRAFISGNFKALGGCADHRAFRAAKVELEFWLNLADVNGG